MDKSIYWSVAIKNSICMICWTILAIVFNKWWIALFCALCMSYVKPSAYHGYYRICDKCGKISPVADSYDKAIEKAEESGWIIKKNGNEWDDRCPECQMKNRYFVG